MKCPCREVRESGQFLVGAKQVRSPDAILVLRIPLALTTVLAIVFQETGLPSCRFETFKSRDTGSSPNLHFGPNQVSSLLTDRDKPHHSIKTRRRNTLILLNMVLRKRHRGPHVPISTHSPQHQANKIKKKTRTPGAFCARKHLRRLEGRQMKHLPLPTPG